MSKNLKKVLALLLALAMVASLAACGGNTSTTTAASEADSSAADETESGDDTDEPAVNENAGYDADVIEALLADDTDYEELSEMVYNSVLGEFYDYYSVAAECTETNERYALMAIAEAKLLESGVMLPTNSQGGSNIISRMAPRTAPTVKWGGDENRYETVLAATDLITAEDYQALKDIWEEEKGTGNYLADAKAYLEDKGYTLKDTLNLAYSSDTDTWDLFAEWNATLYEPMAGTFDNLMKYDAENNLQPALAESYEVSEDGTVYTFHLRQGVMWVDSQGREVAEVTADDWVAAAEHLFDAASSIEDLWTVDGCGIVGATDYYYGNTDDFSTVGVKAVDEYTLEYTLEAPCPYFMTMLTYTTFAPLCRSYYLSQGGNFKSEVGEDNYTSGDYGTDPDHIVYCGPYLITSATEKNSIIYKANEAYWNAENVTIKNINWLYDDGSDPKKTYDDCLNAVTDSCNLNASIVEMAKEDGTYEKYSHVSDTDATCYLIYYNLCRGVWTNYNDETALVSEKTDEQKEVSMVAANDQHFRLAMNYALDRITYNAQAKGEELATKNLNNSYTTGDFVYLTEDVTVDINGTETTFAAGTYYGEILQAQRDADGSSIKAWDAETQSSHGYDGYYNPEAAQEEIELAVADLAELGYEVTAENPIVLDYPVWDGSEIYINRANAYKQSIETNTNGLVQVNIITCSDVYDWYYAEYFATQGSDMNYDIGDMTGWSPDYGDPCGMLATFLPDYASYCTMSLGIY